MVKQKVKKIGFVALSAKPFHAGDFNLIHTASWECDEVFCIVSTKDTRANSGIPIHHSTMKRIWEEEINKIIPQNVTVIFTTHLTYAVCKKINKTYKLYLKQSQKVKIFIYKDDCDKQFGKKFLKKYSYRAYINRKISTRIVPRAETDYVSETLMRKYVADDNFNDFVKGLPLPFKTNVEINTKIWQMLRNDMINDNIVCVPVTPMGILNNMRQLSAIYTTYKYWSDVKHELFKWISPNDRQLFAHRHHYTGNEHPDAFEMALMHKWVQLTHKNLLYKYDNEERMIEYIEP